MYRRVTQSKGEHGYVRTYIVVLPTEFVGTIFPNAVILRIYPVIPENQASEECLATESILEIQISRKSILSQFPIESLDNTRE